jgi:hypothetical protein
MMKLKFIPMCLVASASLLAADDDRASLDNADNARDSNDNGSGRGVDCGCCDWQSRDRDNNQPSNENCNDGLHTPSWDRKD